MCPQQARNNQQETQGMEVSGPLFEALPFS